MVSRRWLSSAQVPPELCSRGAIIDVTLLERQTDFACEFRGEALQPTPDTVESVKRFSDSWQVFGASEFRGRSGLNVYCATVCEPTIPAPGLYRISDRGLLHPKFKTGKRFKFRQAVDVGIRREVVHHAGERVAGP
jgi:hypothetical protein